jgi:hypothetical protein
MGCGYSMQNAVIPFENQVVEEAIVKIDGKKSKFGIIHRIELPKDTWLARIEAFIHSHINTINKFSHIELVIMMHRLHEFRKAIDKSDAAIRNPFTNAVNTLDKIFFENPNDISAWSRQLIKLATTYSKNNDEIYFEEIMFMFTVIVNAPLMRFFETTY